MSIPLTTILAELHKEISKVVPNIIKSLNDEEEKVCQASVNALSELLVHGKTGHL